MDDSPEINAANKIQEAVRRSLACKRAYPPLGNGRWFAKAISPQQTPRSLCTRFGLSCLRSQEPGARSQELSPRRLFVDFRAKISKNFIDFLAMIPLGSVESSVQLQVLLSRVRETF